MAAQLMLHSRLEELNNQSSDRLHSLRKRNEVKSTTKPKLLLLMRFQMSLPPFSAIVVATKSHHPRLSNLIH